MATASSVLKLDKLPARQASALRRRARTLGLTPVDYVKQLIQDDLALDQKARSSSLDELAAPFRKALGDVPETELDQMVHAARARHCRTSTVRR